VWHDSFIKCDTIRLTCHDSLILTNNMNSLILTNNMSHYDWFICVTWRRGYISFVCAWVHDDDQTRVYTIDTGWWHDSSIKCDTIHLTCHDPLIRTNNTNSLILTNNMSHYDWFIRVTWLIHKYDTIHRCIYRVAKTHRVPYLHMSFPQKSLLITGLSCENIPVTRGIWCIYVTL